MRLYLVRHGRTPSNVARLLDTAVPGADLDAVGLAQADTLVERLAGHRVDAVYASDLVPDTATFTTEAVPAGDQRGTLGVAASG